MQEENNLWSRRDFTKLAIAGVAGLTVAATATTATAEPGVAPPEVADQPWVTPRKSKYVLFPELKRRKIEVPDIQLDGETFQVLKGDFHTHTCLSDGHVWPDERVLGCYESGLDVIAITEHIEHRFFDWCKIDLSQAGGHNFSSKFAKEFSQNRFKDDFIVIRGAEISKEWSIPRPGHLNALFLKDVNAVADKVNDWRAMVQEAVNQEAFVMWNHPRSDGLKRPGDDFGPCFWYPEIEEIYQKGQLHGVECFNDDRYFVKPLDWACDKNLALLFDTDIHDTECRAYGHNNPYRPMTLIFAKEKSESGVREALFARRTVGWGGNILAGPEKLVRTLFNTCIDWSVANGKLTLKNKSSLNCVIACGDDVQELNGKTDITFDNVGDKVTFEIQNWYVRSDQSLKITNG